MTTMPETSNHERTDWTGKFEIDGSELYQYTADFGTLVIKIYEDFFDEPDEDIPEDDPGYYEIDKSFSLWNAECRYYGDPELFHLGESHRVDPQDAHPEANVAFVYSHSEPSADEALLRLLAKVPAAWLHDAFTHKGKVWQGWTESYQNVAGKVAPPIWL